MKAYSSADLLGKESNLSNIKSSIIYWFETWIDKQTTDIELEITVPQPIYLRTKLICDYIESVYETDFNVPVFLDTLYRDFIHRTMKKHNPMKMYDELTMYDFASSDSIQINDNMNNTIHRVRRNFRSNAVLGISVSKKDIKRGEIILAELDEVVGKFFTVEDVLSRLWTNFIQSFSDGNNEKAVDKILKMAAKNF